MNLPDYRKFLAELIQQHKQGILSEEDLAHLLWERENNKWSSGFNQGKNDPDFENGDEDDDDN